MKHLFVTVELALKLNKLDFREKCLAFLDGFGSGEIINHKYVTSHIQAFYPDDFLKSEDVCENLNMHCFGICGIPLYQQVLDWLRDKHGIYIDILTSSKEDLSQYPNSPIIYEFYVWQPRKAEVIGEKQYSIYYDCLKEAIDESIKLIENEKEV